MYDEYTPRLLKMSGFGSVEELSPHHLQGFVLPPKESGVESLSSVWIIRTLVRMILGRHAILRYPTPCGVPRGDMFEGQDAKPPDTRTLIEISGAT